MNAFAIRERGSTRGAKTAPGSRLHPDFVPGPAGETPAQPVWGGR